MTEPDGNPDVETGSGRSAQTRMRYRRRVRNLLRRYDEFVADLASIEKSADFTSWLIDRRSSWMRASWRQNKAAVVSVFEERRNALRHRIAQAPDDGRGLVAEFSFLDDSLDRLSGATEAGCAASSRQTSACKAKRFPPIERARVAAALNSVRSRYAPALDVHLTAGALTGLRPDEWRDVVLRIGEAPGDMVLTVRNAKHDRERGHGEFRTLTWHGLDDESGEALRTWVAIAHAAEASGIYDVLMQGMGRLLHNIVRTLWPRKLRRPTLYSLRHEFAAVAKLMFDPAEVAALMGHASDETATKHYGRYKHTVGRLPLHRQKAVAALPRPNPVEVAQVHRLLEGKLARLADLATGLGAAARPP
jgi:integrase